MNTKRRGAEGPDPRTHTTPVPPCVETAYFAYFSRELGGKAYLCVRKIKNTGLFKPYAIIDQNTFDAEVQNLRK